MAVDTTEEYLALLAQSGVLPDGQLSEVQQRYADQSDPRKLARKLVTEGYLTDWQARFLLTGRHHLKVGQYTLLDRVSRDATGDRFLAVHEQLDRKVDVLIFPAKVTQNKSLFDRFTKQAAIVANLDHDNLLHVYDIDKEGGRYFLVLEHDAGQALSSLAKGSLSSEDLSSITRQILEGLAYAHRNQVVHGKLDASQVRIDDKGKVTLRNIGLAKMLDQLLEQQGAPDEFAIQADPVDDVIAAGQLCCKLFKHHLGNAVDQSANRLYILIQSVTQVIDADPQTVAPLIANLKQWQDEVSSSNRSVQTSRVPPAENKVATAKPRQTGKVAPGRDPGKQKLLLGGLAGVAVVALAACLWLLLGSGEKETVSENKIADSGSAAKSTTDSEKRDVVSPDPANTDKETDRDTEPKGKDEVKPPTSTSGENIVDDETTTDDSSESGDNVVDRESQSGTSDLSDTELDWSNAGEEQATGSGTAESAATESPDAPPEPMDPPERIVMSGVEGLELVAWSAAPGYEGKEIVVYGTIVDVGSSRSGKTRYLNFKKDDFDAFKIVVRDREMKDTEEELKEVLLAKNVCIHGTVSLFQGKPQIILQSMDRVHFVEVLPDENTRLVDKANNTMPEIATTGVFAGMAGALGIPELERETTDFERHLLGPVAIGNDPLGLFLIVPEEACDRPIWFDIERDQTGRRWEIYHSARARDADSEKTVVAEIHFENDQLYFNWVKPETWNAQVNYLQNCLLEIKAPTESKTVILRAPIQTDPIVLDDRRPVFKEKLDLRYLPRPDSISVEFLPLPKSEFENQVSDAGTTLGTAFEETSVFFDPLPENQFFRLWHAAEISNVIRIETELQINSPEKPLVFNARNLRALESSLLAMQTRISEANSAANEYDPPRGEITKHKDLVKELSKQLEMINGQVNAFQVAKPLIESIPGRPIRYRIYFTVGDAKFDLLTTRDPDQSSETATSQENR